MIFLATWDAKNVILFGNLTYKGQQEVLYINH